MSGDRCRLRAHPWPFHQLGADPTSGGFDFTHPVISLRMPTRLRRLRSAVATRPTPASEAAAEAALTPRQREELSAGPRAAQ